MVGRHGASVTVLDDNARRDNLIKRILTRRSARSLLLRRDFRRTAPQGRLDRLSWNFSALGFPLIRKGAGQIALITSGHLTVSPIIEISQRNDYITEKETTAGFVRIRAMGAFERARLAGRRERLPGFSPWPDIAMKKEDFIKKIGMGQLLRRRIRHASSACAFWIISAGSTGHGIKHHALFIIRGAPALIKMFWAHHRYLLFAPRTHPMIPIVEKLHPRVFVLSWEKGRRTRPAELIRMENIVSIIIPSYNSALTIGPCLESQQRQTYTGEREIILVDSSDDETPAIVAERFPSVDLLHLDIRTDAGSARILGVKRARGRIIAFIDSDCVAAADWLDKIVVALSGPYGAVGGAIHNGNDEADLMGWAVTSPISRVHPRAAKAGGQTLPHMQYRL